MTIITAIRPHLRGRAQTYVHAPSCIPTSPFVEFGPWEPDLSRQEAADLTAMASAAGVRQSSRNGSYQGSR